MSKSLILAEKPSVARDIAKVLSVKTSKDGYMESDKYIVTWCVGHLVGLAYPTAYDEKYKSWKLEDLPIIPEQMKYEVLEATKKQFKIIKDLLNDKDISAVIIATDAGREGELIGRLVVNQSKCNKPLKRLWISSMTDEAIQAGFDNLKDGRDYDNLFKSAECRAIADWLIGINASRKYSIEYSKLTLGRVQTPTLAMIVQRQHEIDNFISKPFYEVLAQYKDFTGKYANEENESRFDTIDGAEELIKRIKGHDGQVVDIEKKNKKKNNPLQYDLTELQREANRQFGLTAQETLNIAQSLYEKHKLTTYPRTDSRYLSTDMVSTFPELLKNISNNFYGDEIKKILEIAEDHSAFNINCINNSKITDHHAIIPTAKKADLSQLSTNELNIYRIICTRFVAAFMPVHLFEETTVKVSINREVFISKGVVVTQNGWLEIEKDGEKEEENKEKLPLLKNGDAVEVLDILRIDKKTSPKKPFNEATLLSAMENAGQFVEDEELKEQLKEKGLGTPATRAGIIEKLIHEEYIKRSGKTLVPTQKGTDLVKIAPKELVSPELTGEWEQKLNKIAKGQLNNGEFLNEIKSLTRTIVNVKKDSDISFKSNEKAPEREIIGICPRCGKNIYENDKSYYCEGFKNEPKCSFSIWKADKYFGKINKTQAKKMLKGEVALFKKLKNKKGDEYEAFVKIEDTGKYVNLKIDSYNNK